MCHVIKIKFLQKKIDDTKHTRPLLGAKGQVPPDYLVNRTFSAATLYNAYTNVGKIQRFCHCLLPILKEGRLNTLALFSARRFRASIIFYCLH